MTQMSMMQAERTVTATTSDVLGATQLRVAPGPGAIAVFLASTQADSQATVTIGGLTQKANSVIGKVATNAQVSTNDDTPVMAAVGKGDVITVDVTVVTAATIRVLAIWQGTLI